MNTTPDDAQTCRAGAVEFGLVLRRAQHLLSQRIDDTVGPLELNLGLWRVLLETANHPGASASELARASFHTPQTLSGLLRRLQDRGLVERATGRGRIVENYLTSTGREVLDAATRRVAQVVEESMSALNPQQRACLEQLMTSYADTLAQSKPTPIDDSIEGPS